VLIVTNVWSWATLSLLLSFHSDIFPFSSALQPWLILASFSFRIQTTIRSYISEARVFEAVPCIYGGNSEVKVTRDIHHGYWWDDPYVLHSSAFQRHTLTVKSTAHSVEVRICQVRMLQFLRPYDREWKSASWGDSLVGRISYQRSTESERCIWFQIRICLRTGYKQSRNINQRAKRNIFEYRCARFQSIQISPLTRKDTTYQSANNRAQQQSESPVVVSMGIVSPETVTVGRYYRTENLVFLAPKKYEKIWMSISSNLDRIQATRVTINN